MPLPRVVRVKPIQIGEGGGASADDATKQKCCCCFIPPLLGLIVAGVVLLYLFAFPEKLSSNNRGGNTLVFDQFIVANNGPFSRDEPANITFRIFSTETINDEEMDFYEFDVACCNGASTRITWTALETGHTFDHFNLTACGRKGWCAFNWISPLDASVIYTTRSNITTYHLSSRTKLLSSRDIDHSKISDTNWYCDNTSFCTTESLPWSGLQVGDMLMSSFNESNLQTLFDLHDRDNFTSCATINRRIVEISGVSSGRLCFNTTDAAYDDAFDDMEIDLTNFLATAHVYKSHVVEPIEKSFSKAIQNDENERKMSLDIPLKASVDLSRMFWEHKVGLAVNLHGALQISGSILKTDSDTTASLLTTLLSTKISAKPYGEIQPSETLSIDLVEDTGKTFYVACIITPIPLCIQLRFVPKVKLEFATKFPISYECEAAAIVSGEVLLEASRVRGVSGKSTAAKLDAGQPRCNGFALSCSFAGKLVVQGGIQLSIGIPFVTKDFVESTISSDFGFFYNVESPPAKEAKCKCEDGEFSSTVLKIGLGDKIVWKSSLMGWATELALTVPHSFVDARTSCNKGTPIICRLCDTMSPTVAPTYSFTLSPTYLPTLRPTINPTLQASTEAPTTGKPDTASPTIQPTPFVSNVRVECSACSQCRNASHILVPALDDGFVAPFAFKKCAKLVSVELAEGVVIIGEGAFYDCTNLIEVLIPNTVSSIGTEAFSYTTLKSVSIPGSVSSIGDYAFFDCTELAVVNISHGVTTIGDYAFETCLKLESIVIPNSITHVGRNVFAHCEALSSVTLEPGLKRIGRAMFASCYSLKSVTIPSSVEQIDESAFSGCTSLISVTLEDGVSLIGDSMFRGCALTFIAIPSSVKKIGVGAFASCTTLQSIVIPNAVQSIGTSAFESCYSLQTAVIGSDVVSIGNRAFSSCSSLTSLLIPNGVRTIGNYAFSSCSKLQSVAIPSSVTYVGEGAFSYCSSMLSLTISNGVGAIGYHAFNSCSKLQSVAIPSSVTYVGEGAFGHCTSLYCVLWSREFTLKLRNEIFFDTKVSDLGWC